MSKMRIALTAEDMIMAVIARSNRLHDQGQSASDLGVEARRVLGLVDGRIRDLICNLARSANYLEVGSCCGATAVAASTNGKGKYWSIDIFSEWHLVKDLLMTGLPVLGDFEEIRHLTMQQANEYHCKKFGSKYQLIVQDSMAVDLPKLLGSEKLDVFYYDGDHGQDPTRDNIIKYSAHFADQCILLVDDFNDAGVQSGVRAALWNIPYHVIMQDIQPWWNGFAVIVLQREELATQEESQPVGLRADQAVSRREQ
tara:strand:+ start:91 stop:855 length:765 start_codon:yes stop_codon:yes gene_type:complete